MKRYQRTFFLVARAVVSIWGLLFGVFNTNVYAQSPLDAYVREALKSNLVLQKKNISLKQAQEYLQIARSSFLPSVVLQGDYTTGEGGRSISIPAGDLLNPVFKSLNELSTSRHYSDISNIDQNFIPANFFDSKIRTTVPVINTGLNLNKNIRKQQEQLAAYDLDIYARQLVFDIKYAYYSLLSLMADVKIYESALLLAAKNVQVNESFMRNGKMLPANYLRSQSEVELIKAELNSAANKVSNAKMYFNFLLNRQLGVEVDTGTPVAVVSNLSDTISVDVTCREELKMLQAQLKIGQYTLRKDQLSYIPAINAMLDVGSQTSNWKFDNKAFYYQVGIQFYLPLYQGSRNKRLIQSEKLEIQRTELDLDNTGASLQLAAAVAKNNLVVSRKNYAAAQGQIKSAESYFRAVEKGYLEGAYSLIELVDARNQLTLSQLRESQRLFEILIAEAKLERETSSYNFKK